MGGQRQGPDRNRGFGLCGCAVSVITRSLSPSPEQDVDHTNACLSVYLTYANKSPCHFGVSGVDSESETGSSERQ
jgi:hypothetical protein